MVLPSWASDVPPDFRERIRQYLLSPLPKKVESVELLLAFFSSSPTSYVPTPNQQRAVLIYLQVANKDQFYKRQGSTTRLEMYAFFTILGETYGIVPLTSPAISMAKAKISLSQEWIYMLIARFIQEHYLETKQNTQSNTLTSTELLEKLEIDRYLDLAATLTHSVLSVSTNFTRLEAILGPVSLSECQALLAEVASEFSATKPGRKRRCLCLLRIVLYDYLAQQVHVLKQEAVQDWLDS